MNFPTITRYNWMCCSIILVFLALSSPKPLQAQENQKENYESPSQPTDEDVSDKTATNEGIENK